MNFSDFFFNSPLQLLLQNERETLFLPAHKSSPPTRLKYLKIISKFDEIYSKALGFFQGNLFINTFKIDIFEVLRTDTSMVCIYSYAGAPWDCFAVIDYQSVISTTLAFGIRADHPMKYRDSKHFSISNQKFEGKIQKRCKANMDLHKNQSQLGCRSKQPLLTVYTRYVFFVVIWKTGKHRQSGY